jgi:hypothetical protein
MHPWKDQTFMLRVASRIDAMPVVVQCVEAAAGVFGLGREETLKLALATEEIFAYLCRDVCRGKPLEVECRNNLYYTQVRFLFAMLALNTGGLNVSSAMADDSETALADMGIIIAARSVDRLHIVSGKQHHVSLMLDKEKAYPHAPQIPLPPPDPAGKMTPVMPDGDALKQLAIRVAQAYPVPIRPPFFNYPGKVADMVESGEYGAFVVKAQKGDISGGVLFKFRTDRIVQLFGPFVFSPSAEDEIANRLLESCFYHLARTKAVGLVCLNGMPVSLQGHFEPLGTLRYNRENGESFGQPCFYRLLHEDPGSVVWSHAELRDYLNGEYQRLILARDIRVVQDLGETSYGHSMIIPAATDRDMSAVTLKSLWPGVDFTANLKRHVRMLRKECMLNIFFELDLGLSWHVKLIPGLLANGFRPEIILPFAGQADLVVFQHHEQEPIPRAAADLTR